MDAVLLARIKFAPTVGFHYIFPPLTIGLGWMIFHYNNRYQENGDPIAQQQAKFWTRVFAITFIVAVWSLDLSHENTVTQGGAFLVLFAAAVAALFPNMVPCTNEPEWSLTVFNASSSKLTLFSMLVIALVGMPIVLGYTWFIHHVFRDKVKVAEDGD